MNTTFQDRLFVIVAPVLCTALALGWTLIRGEQIADAEIGVVADAPGTELGGSAAVPTAPMPAATQATEIGNVVPTEALRDPQSSDRQNLDSTVGDYGQPDPLPADMLRRSYQAARLGLLDPQDQPVSDVRLSATAGRIAGDLE